MPESQSQYLSHMNHLQRSTIDQWTHYWSLYSGPATWQFWFTCFLLIAPLVLLYVMLDRRRALLIGFFGFNVHVWFGYIDAFGAERALWSYPYKLIPFLPMSVSLDVSLVPIVYMLVYQWTTNTHRNYYLYATITSLIFAFVFKPIMSALNMFHLYYWMNYFYLFLGYMVVMVVSKLITDVFVSFEKSANREVSRTQGVRPTRQKWLSRTKAR
ncbi:CBO0543 family protein [Alicyclobacillus acidoterrestris]|uniref:Uncharacterized protein n=1 Tax=Alicyclobacillus acidoterrestris (strain ATCC 49025 / DSM 3922 / CIP 106132 / NCIMB 13137 / GD3B) TaxID=1356854 RepID=T0BTI7_ALIAG|nr:CBO0543 family protein [Alicyclobacillus acidoterrestris]EPZ47393.1 hypothetical protein N007_06170 [Alicyclobacillus acidoterrestris ATCC 49025]UNO48292.1 hypothetical protein K1I37_16695 [Alicyclobacillus acidoterrestris]